MSADSLTRFAGITQRLAFAALLIFTPLARGATPRWAFCIALWLLLLALSGMVLKRTWQSERFMPPSPLDLPVTLLLMLALGSVFTSIYPFASSWALLRLLLYLGVFYLTLDIAPSRQQTKRLVLIVLGVGTALAFIGFVKYQGGTFPGFWDYGQGHGGDQRLNSTFLNANHAAGYLEMVLAVGLALFLYRPLDSSLIWSLPLLLILVALCLTLSRGGWLSTLLALDFMFALFLLKKGVSRLKVWSITVGLLLALSLTILASNPMIKRLQSMHKAQEPSLVGRLAVWKGSIEVAREKPLLGSGPGTFPWAFTTVRSAGLTRRYREAHNDYVQVVTELGLPVLVVLIWGIFLVFRSGVRSFRETRSRFHSGVTLGALGGIVAILAHSLSDFNIQITANGILFSLLVGLAVGSEAEGRWQEQASSDQLSPCIYENRCIPKRSS